MQIASILSWAKRAPTAVQALMEAENDHLHAQRAQWDRELKEAYAEHAAVFPALWAAEQTALERLEETKKKAAEMIQEAEKKYKQAQSERQRADEARDRKTGPLLTSLRKTAPEEIYEFRSKLEERRLALTPDKIFGKDQSGRQIVTHSNYRSIQAASLRILEIERELLPELQLKALSSEQLQQALDELERSIPEVKIEPLEVQQ
jgi:hypothetical protein